MTDVDRRTFLRTGLLGASAMVPALQTVGRADRIRLALIVDPSDPVASSAPVQWAIGELETELKNRNITVRVIDRLPEAGARDIRVVVSGHAAPAAADALKRERIALDDPEQLALFATSIAGRRVLVACGTDARGLAYALTELADRVHFAASPLSAF